MTETPAGSQSGGAADTDAAAQRVRELSDQVIAQAKKNGLAFLEGYERVLRTMLDMEEKAARGFGQDWTTSLAKTHADFVRDTSEVFLKAWRDQLSS